ncbi:kinesin-like protein KIN-6 isoform X2 [Humulus lupulus]|uniref:kinesin-like protein KIN-6 isoform X2 n=1 Tax=Humulus lupulus TaxID=3486 RepID=UPI002B4063C5|nr:kinesin-like protein KIN-6 isoform X2 [Humulus lupulus]
METKSPQTCLYSVTVRRNPPRKARPTTTATKSRQVPLHSSSSTVPDIPSFPTEEILCMEVSENPKPKLLDSTSENLKVFLRVRPILPSTSLDKDHNPKSRAKNAWPQNPAKKTSARDATKNKKKSGEICVKVNDCHSVTLTPPLNLQGAKRVKSEVYEGFSHVFAPDSSQEEVYEKMVSSLVEDFLKGKSGMLATLGPSGSGKTHTVFGSVRDPGILPRTLHQIFKPPAETASELRRSFSISIFEIQSERKGEKLFDLSPGGGGADLTMQKSAIKGLQEITVTDARQAESLVAHAMLNRLTATTNTNSQSSRSQCIINIHSVASEFEGEDEYQTNSAVLSIVDLAGAEREKKTGNQGARLLESNFINNTSMVFGSCLRSLLEHQRNPKRPLQKHFQNSLLTRYLREYLEGKKRMALILTVKSGEEDYLNTTYLLRQASPLMRIRFDNIEEPPNVPSNKRQYQAFSRNKQPKRMKFSDACGNEEGKADEDDAHTSGKGCVKEDTKIFISEISDCTPLELSSVDLERNCEIWQSFAKAFWNTLKQYKEKLKVAENEIHHLTKNLKLEKARYVALEKKLGDAESYSNFSLKKSVEIALVETETNLNYKEKLNRPDICDFDKSNVDLCYPNLRPSECNCTPKTYDSTSRQDQVTSSQTNIAYDSLDFRVSSSSRSSDKFDSNTDQDQSFSQLQVKEEDYPSQLTGLECVDNEQIFGTPVRDLVVGMVDDSSSSVEISQQNYQINPVASDSEHNAEHLHESKCLGTDDACTNAFVTDLTVNSSQSPVMHREGNCSSVELDHLVNEEEQGLSILPETEDIISTEGYTAVDSLVSESNVVSTDDYTTVDALVSKWSFEKPEELLGPSTSLKEDLAITKDCKVVNVPNNERSVDTSSKPGKPRRRLLPASSVLLKDFSTLDIEDKSEKRKENKGAKKFHTEERNRTQGSISLLRLLNNNIGG